MNKDQLHGTTKNLTGKVQEAAGKLVGNKQQQSEGLKKQVEGKVQEAVGDVKKAVKDLHK